MTGPGGDGWVSLRRACSATTVPLGQPVELGEGGQVQVVQQRGGSLTLRTEMGTLLRIDATDADAVGLEAPERRVLVRPDQPFHLDLVIEALATVYDPEIPISIVIWTRLSMRGGRRGRSRRIEIDMTMTAPDCGMGDVLRDGPSVVEQVSVDGRHRTSLRPALVDGTHQRGRVSSSGCTDPIPHRRPTHLWPRSSSSIATGCVDRLWPRVARPLRSTVGGFAPSSDLRRWYDHRVDRFDEFGHNYRIELGLRPPPKRSSACVPMARSRT